ncbi:MAG: ExeA family protein, partial [Pirellulaceae bacterium]
MYTEYFQLTQRPFSRVPSVTGCVMFPGIKSSYDRCCEGIDEAAGPVLIVAPSGCGKSTLLALVEHRYREQLTTVTLNCAAITSRHELIQCLLFELALPFESSNVGDLRLKLIDHLKSTEHCPDGLLLLVDEGHNLSAEVLEELRMITNLVCGGRHQIRLVLAGCRPLEEKLAWPQLESFNQRISVRCYLQPMSRNETLFYALAQIQMCGRDGREIFQPSALDKLYDISDGVPRLAAQLCDHSLKTACKQGQLTIDGPLVQKAWLDLQQLPEPAEFGDLDSASNDSDSSVVEFGSLDDSAAFADTQLSDNVDSLDAGSTEDSYDIGPMQPAINVTDDSEPE